MRSKQAGFTLVEVVLYIAIVATLLLAISGFLVNMLAANTKNNVITEVDQQANQVLSLIEEVGQNATAVTLPIAGATGGTLTFTMPSAVTTIFTQTAGAITVNEGSGAVSLTNSRVLSSGFSANNLTAGVTSGTVRVQFTLSYVNNSGRSEYNYTKNYVTSVTIRR